MKKAVHILCTTGMFFLCVISFFACATKKERIVPFLDIENMVFGTSEQEVCSILGKPERIYQDGVSVQKMLYYDLPVFGDVASVEFCLNMETDELWQVTYVWQAENAEQLGNMYLSVEETIKRELGEPLKIEEPNIHDIRLKNYIFAENVIELSLNSDILRLRIRNN